MDDETNGRPRVTVRADVPNGFESLSRAELERLRKFARRAFDVADPVHLRTFAALMNELDAEIGRRE